MHPGLMATTVPRILLTGPPRAGKTTLVCRLAHELAAVGVVVGGFVTREIREEGQRVGFSVEEIGGPQALLAHVALPEGPSVGRYRVDVAAFEGLALPAIERVMRRGGIAIIDELGQMELLSSSFIESFKLLLDNAIPLAATIHARSHPFTDAVRQRPGIEMVEVDRSNAGELLGRLVARFFA